VVATGATRTQLIELGRVRGAYGVRGWVKVAPHTPSAEVLRTNRRWWLLEATGEREVQVSAVRRQGAGLVAKWDGCDSPEAADALKGTAIAVARRDFPPLPVEEFYWVDLIGLQVINRRKQMLGVVKGLRASAGHDVLEIEPATRVGQKQGAQILVPMVGDFIDGIDLQAGTICVNWEPEWLA
jgi:16S rRNA processing protein RimM